MYVIRTEVLGQEHSFNFEKDGVMKEEAEAVVRHDVDLALEDNDSQRLAANRISSIKDNDKAKIDLIKSEFILDFCADSVNLLHLALLMVIRGLNLSIFNHCVLGNQLV